jgi:hypothetical protein
MESAIACMPHEKARMSRFARRSWHPHRTGRFVITLELDPVADGHTIERHRELEAVTKRLVDLFTACRLPATWAVSDPAFSAATSLVLQSPVAHEIAILGDPSWLGPTAGRTRFARELERRVMKSRSMGIRVTSLVPRGESIQRHIDLVVKNGITAVTGMANAAPSMRPVIPQALHYGVWQLAGSIAFPQQAAGFLSTWRLGRRLRRAAHEAALFHLIIDVRALAEEGARIEKRLTRVARHLAELQKRGLARVEPLGATAARLAEVPAASPQRSILRAA